MMLLVPDCPCCDRAVTVFVQAAGAGPLQSIVGKHIRTLPIRSRGEYNHASGLAVSPDSVTMAISDSDHTVTVFALPNGDFVREFGTEGDGPSQFGDPGKLCFSPLSQDRLLVAEWRNKRVQEVTLTGDHVRFIGVGVIDDGIECIATNCELVVVGKHSNSSNRRVMMFGTVSGDLVRAFGNFGDKPGQLMHNCYGVRIAPGGHRIIVAEWNGSRVTGPNEKGRLSVFTITGEFVKCIGEHDLKEARDVDFADNGDIIVSDAERLRNHRICVFSADGSELKAFWGGSESVRTDIAGRFKLPNAIAMRGGRLYVLDEGSKRVQVFE